MTPPGDWSLRGGRRLFYKEAASTRLPSLQTRLHFRDNPQFVAHPFVLVLLLLLDFLLSN